MRFSKKCEQMDFGYSAKLEKHSIFFHKSTENTLLINLVSLVRKMRKRKFACKPTITVSIGDTNKHEGSTKKKEHIPNLMLPFGDLERV